RRLFAAGSDLEAAGLVEGGTHFLGGVGKALKRYRNSADPAGQVAVMQALVDQIVKQRFREVLPLYQRGMEMVIDDFRRSPSRIGAITVRSYINQMGHILELALDPDNAVSEAFTRSELSGYVQTLASAMERWY